MKLSQRAETTEPFHALAIGQRAAELAAQGHHVVRLSIGEPDFGAPPEVLAALRDVADGRPLPYTPALGLPELRAAIARNYRDRHGVDVDPARIAVTSGASAACCSSSPRPWTPATTSCSPTRPTPATGS